MPPKYPRPNSTAEINNIQIHDDQYECDHVLYKEDEVIYTSRKRPIVVISVFCPKCDIITFECIDGHVRNADSFHLCNMLRVMGFKKFKDVKDCERVLDNLFHRDKINIPKKPHNEYEEFEYNIKCKIARKKFMKLKKEHDDSLKEIFSKQLPIEKFTCPNPIRKNNAIVYEHLNC